MTTKSYRGDAPAVSKVIVIRRPIAYQGGRITLVINNKRIPYPSWDATQLANAWNNSGYPEVANILALAGSDETGAYGTSFGSLILTSQIPGEDFFVSVFIGDEDGVSISNEVQQLTFSVSPSSGTFTLTFNGQTTGAITYLSGNLGGTAAAIQAALEALSNIAPGDVTVTASSATSFFIAFAGTYINVNVPQITAANIDLVAPIIGDPTTTEVQIGVLPVNEVQTLSLPNTPTGGTFTLTFNGQTTGTIAWNASAATVQTALVALSNIASGDVVCAGGNLPGTPVTITFAQAYAGQDIPLITGNGASLSGGSANVTNITTIRTGAALIGAATRTIKFNANPSLITAANLVSFNFMDAVGNIVTSAAIPANSVVADFKALFVGKTIGYVVDPLNAIYENYVIQSSDIDVTGGLLGGATLTVTFNAYLAYPSKPTIFSGTTIGPNIIGMLVSGLPTSQFNHGGTDAIGSYEEQTFEVLDSRIPGNYTLTVYDTSGSPHTTGPIAYNASLSDIQAAINAALSGSYVWVRIADAAPTDPANGRRWQVNYWSYLYATTNMTTLVSNEGTTSIIQSIAGSAGTSEIQNLTIIASVLTPIEGGTYTLTYLGQTTSDIPYAADSAAIRLALEALSNLAPGDLISVSGDLLTGIQIAFNASFGRAALIDLDTTDILTTPTLKSLTSQAGGLEIFTEETVRNQGPNCFDDPLNYDPIGVPSDGDDLNFEYGLTDCLWGIKQRDTFTVLSTSTEQCQLTTKRPLFQNDQKVFFTSDGTPPAGLTNATAYFIVNMDDRGRFQLSTTLGGSPLNLTSTGTGTHTLGLRLGILRKPARYSFMIGLLRDNVNGFVEYRPRYLEVYTDQIILGEGNGNDSSLIRLDTGIRPISNGIQIFATGSRSESQVPATTFLIDNDTVDIVAYRGDIGLSPHLDEVSVIHDVELHNTQLSSVGQVTCNNITGDKSSTVRGNFVPSGTVKLGL